MGRLPSLITEGRDEDEWRKRLTAILRNGPSVVLIDNLRRRLDSAALSAVLTAPTWEDRVLGHSETVRLPVRCAWVGTGNNPALSTEVARRTVRIRLDAKHDRPWTRSVEGFRHPNLYAWAAAQRGELIWAALTLIQAWVAHGKPLGAATQILGTFEAWAHTMGGILAVEEIPGFLEDLEAFYAASDEEGELWRAFVQGWWERYGDSPVGVKELWTLVTDEDAPLALPLGEGNEKSQKTRLGKLLQQQRDRQFDDLRITYAGQEQHATH